MFVAAGELYMFVADSKHCVFGSEAIFRNFRCKNQLYFATFAISYCIS